MVFLKALAQPLKKIRNTLPPQNTEGCIHEYYNSLDHKTLKLHTTFVYPTAYTYNKPPKGGVKPQSHKKINKSIPSQPNIKNTDQTQIFN